ncbi:putative transporter, EamA-like family [Variovorax paradoxus B4]|uniref:Putative transporter, EamA-like family n=2 Tax=Variovorax paradoxus TaxID=34073 RepID=T1XAB9_VARPD|nr:putative transporter, EamA-like family [Variovorax paradoxus B4]
MVTAAGALWLPRPAVSWKAVVFMSLTVFTEQFLLQFFGIAFGRPGGLTAFIVQTQALFTVAFAALMFGDRPSTQQMFGVSGALTGLFVIGLTLNGSVPALAFALTLASALSWAAGNLVIKQLSQVNARKP